LEDLSAINYRLQGLAEKKPKTQEIVLVKRIKHRVRSIKGHGWAFESASWPPIVLVIMTGTICGI
jgi:hypothetical protein